MFRDRQDGSDGGTDLVRPGEPRIVIDWRSLERYLKDVAGHSARLMSVGGMNLADGQGLKEFGYGQPLEVVYERDGEVRRAVLSTMRPDRFGHEFLWDRAGVIMFQYYAGNRMDKHVKSIGLGYIGAGGRLMPLREPEEFFVLREMVDGEPYFHDLERIKDGDCRTEDIELAREFGRWLASVHARKLDSHDLYLRRIRDLIAGSECIWGIIDSYPADLQVAERFQDLESLLVDWRWKLRGYCHRLSSVHGDFHPWNVLVRPDGDFSVLDRSRGEWGEPADDVSCMTCNYLLYGLYEGDPLRGRLGKLYMTFWEEYLDRTRDLEMLNVIAPFYVYRSLVIASPVWYPHHAPHVRAALLRFVRNVVREPRFDYRHADKYLE